MKPQSFRIVYWLLGCLLYASAALAAPRTVLIVGDSLSAAYGMEEGQGWVALLDERLSDDEWQVVNASVSGETTDGGRHRLPALLERHRPAVVVIELGGNDGLRALPIERLRANLAAMIETAQSKGASVLLLGMKIPPNYGPVYTRSFEDVFVELARRHKVALVPFLLDGVAGNGGLMQADGIHAAPDAQPQLLENVWPGLQPLLK